ncbi:MAG: carboxypeptidase regulatory-like domain-containing protein [Bacteroidales bacterium]|nr:carboxypeptidase regulatory-like domain-containing protein [Bacteroidales bacterium]
MNRILVVVVMLLGAVSAQAQVSGTVHDADGHPAGYATVLLYADSVTTASPMGYALTTSDGHFAIATEASDNSYLVVRLLGSKEYRHRLGTQREFNIRLEADVHRLNEITVQSTYVPVQVHGDTVSFNTDYFRTGAEETAAEVIKAIPGMEVSESGEVSYAGKTVDKVLVDGKDIFASGSDGALNTLPADAVRGAELLMNYKGGSLIDQFSGREMTALNLKTDGRHRLAGRVGIGGGLIDKWRADASLLFMGKTLSLTSILGANNNGEALFSLEDYIKTVVGLDNLLSSNGRGFNPSDEELAMLMPPGNVYASRSGLATLSGTWTPSDRFKMKGNLMLNGTGLDAATLSLQQYLAFDAMQTHSNDQQSRSLFLTGHLQETWKPSENVEISNLTQLSHTSLFTSDSLDESGLTEMFAREEDDLAKRQLKEELALNVKTGESSLLAVHVAFNLSRRNYSYNLFTDNALLPLAGYDTAADGSFSLDTRRRISETGFAPDVSYAFNITRRLTLTATAAFEHRESAFRYGDDIDESITWNTLAGTLKLSKQHGFLRFSFGADIRRSQWSSTIAGLADSASVDILPSVSVGLAFSEVHRLTISGALERNPIELEYLLRDTLVSGYSSLLAGSDITDPFARSANVQLNYYFFDLFTNTMLFAVAGVTDSRFAVRPHSVQDSSIASLSRYSNDGSLQVRFLNATLRQGLGHLPLDVTVGANLTQSITSTRVNNADAEMSTLAYGGRLGLSSRRKHPLNFDLGGSVNIQSSEFELTESHLWEATAHAALLMAWTRFTARIQLAFSHVDGGENTRNLWDLGFRAEYKMGRWRLTLRGGNLLHLDSQEWISTTTTPLYLATSTYRRLPGYLIGGVAYRF